MDGKKICESLKAIRKSIAQANDIAYNPQECHHEGDCSGTCPACESEMRYIERQLRLRSAMGKAAVVAGLTLGLTSLAPNRAYAQSESSISVQSLMDLRVTDFAPDDSSAVVVRGYVIDSRQRVPLMGTLVALQGTNQCILTDNNGRFAVRVPIGSELELKSVGYYYRSITVNEADDDLIVFLEPESKNIVRGRVPQVVRAEDIYIVKESKITRASLMNLKVQDLAPDDSTAVVVRGVVISDEDKAPAIGAAVAVKGTRLGTMVDQNGLFAIRVPVGSVLEILCLGYEDVIVEVKEATDDLVVKMKDNPNNALVGDVEIARPPMHPADSDIYENQ